METFKRHLTRLPFMAAFMLAVAGMPLDVYAFNRDGVGHAHAVPWMRRCAELFDLALTPIQRLFAALRSPAFWRVAIPVFVLLLVITGHLHASGGGIMVAGVTVQELQEKKLRLAEEAKQLLSDNMRAEDEAKFDAIHVDIEKTTKQIERMVKQDDLDRAMAEPNGRRTEPNTITPQTPTTRHKKVSREDADMALRAWLLAGAEDQDLREDHRLAAQRCGVNLASKSMRIRMSQEPMRTLPDLRTPDVAEWEKRAAMGVGSGSIGGYSVPDAPMGALEKALLAFGGMRAVSTVFRTETGADLPFPTNNDTSNKGRRLSENTSVTETDLTLGQLVLQAYKYSSDSVLVSVEFLQDTSINAADFIGSALGMRIGRVQNDDFTTGTGSSQPNGVVTAATSSAVTFSGAATVTYDNIVDLIHSVDPAYRNNARFMFHDGGLKMLKKVKVLQYSGDTIGVPLWQPSLVAGQPDLIHGYPYVINQSMTTPATTVKSILFGDFSKYLIRDVREVTLIRLDERYADLHQVGFLAFARADSDLLDAGTHPIKYGTQA